MCMMNLTTYIEDASFTYEPSPGFFSFLFFFFYFIEFVLSDKTSLMSSQWFTWCRLCRHGGHAEHLSNWFALNEKCPVAKCFCRCILIDGILFT